VSDVAHALTSLTILPNTIEAPAWISGDGPFQASEILPCRNGLIHLPSLVAGKPYLTPPTPRFFSRNCLDFDFQIDAPPPSLWLKFLGDAWEADITSIEALQEIFGYLLTNDTTQQKIFMLIGPKRSGKGTVARIIAALLGKINVAGPTLSSLGTNFGLWPLLGKPLAIISDARLGKRSDIAQVVERLLSISGEDAQTIDRKNLSAVTTTLPTRFLILTNELPRLNDSSGALVGRMILLRMSRSWYGKEDTSLTRKLMDEIPGILLWAIEGWRRLRDRGHFVQPASSSELIDELDNLSSPVGAFVRERCEVGVHCDVERKKLFDAWKAWCEEQGQTKAGTAIVFGRDLRAVVTGIRDKQSHTDTGVKARSYVGITLKK
jgi:putative DNA primase/helicase